MMVSIFNPLKLPLRKQLLGLLLVCVVLIAISTSVITAWQTSQKIRLSTIETGLQVTSNFADQSVLALITESEDNAKEAVKRATGFESVIGVAVYKSDGSGLIASSKEEANQFYLDISKVANTPILLEETKQSWVFAAPVYFVDDDYDADTIEPDQQLIKKQLMGFVVVNYSTHALQEIQRSIFNNNIVTGCLLAAVLAFLISWGLSKITAPLSSLSQTMEVSGSSGKFLRAEVNGAYEIRQMATTYNLMMSRLELQNIELEKHRANLESEVEIRTQELKVARDTALSASRHKSEFLANMSHELRTPLQAIIGYTDLVKEELEIECMDPQVDDLNRAIRSSHQLLSLINNILDIAKIEAGKMDIYRQSIDTDYLLEETIETIKPMAAANSNELILEKGALNKQLNLDRQKMLQIFLNLLSNACKFTKQGKIKFEIHNDHEFLFFSVTDTGVGIPKNKLEYIFEQFTQVDGSQSRQFEGTGLGMAITRNFCEMMNATIDVTSELGQGTKFSIRMPLGAS